MRQDSNAYIIGFATAVCLVCSIVVSTAAVALRDRQARNKVLDRQTKVLVVAGVLEEGQSATVEEIEVLFEENIETRVVDLASGEYDDSIDAATYDQRKASKDPATSSLAPANTAGITRSASNPPFSAVPVAATNPVRASNAMPIHIAQRTIRNALQAAPSFEASRGFLAAKNN